MFADRFHTEKTGAGLASRIFAFAFFSLTLLAVTPDARASAAAERYVNQVGSGVLAAANSGSAAQFRAILRRHTDLRTIAKFALGRYARKLPAQERSKFHLVVESMITNAFAANSSRLRGQSIRITGSTPSGKHGIVVSTQIVGGSGMQLKWRVAKAGGGFKVMDINVSGIWLSQRLRQKVANQLKRSNKDFVAALNTLK